MSTSERNELRKVFFDSWEKHLQQQPLQPLEAQLLDIILLHPEVQPLLNQPKEYQDRDFDESNPFLHLGLHLALREQVGTNRPEGIQTVYTKLCIRYNDVHQAEHQMMDCLAEMLWQSQVNNKIADEKVYLEMLLRL